MNKLFILSILISAVLLSACSPEQTIDNKSIKVIEQFNEKCPMMIDAETRMDGIEIKGKNTIVYNYTLINLKAENVDTSKFNTALRPGIITTIQENADIEYLRQIQSSFEYRYKDKDKKFIYSFVITPNDYNN